MRIVVDLDDCLVTGGTAPCRYMDSVVVWEYIDKLRELKKAGHTIVLATARGMNRSNGNFITVANAVNAEVTELLAQYGLEDLFSEIHFAKPYGACYVDDKAVPARYIPLLGNKPSHIAELLSVLNSDEVYKLVEEQLNERFSAKK